MPAIRGPKSKSKTRRRTRDVDQVYEDLRSAKHLAEYKDTKAAEDLPSLGQWYCIECAKWFDGEYSLNQHKRGKPHKRRLRQLKETPYSQLEAEAAAGLTRAPRMSEKMIIETTQDASQTNQMEMK